MHSLTHASARTPPIKRRQRSKQTVKKRKNYSKRKRLYTGGMSLNLYFNLLCQEFPRLLSKWTSKIHTLWLGPEKRQQESNTLRLFRTCLFIVLAPLFLLFGKEMVSSLCRTWSCYFWCFMQLHTLLPQSLTNQIQYIRHKSWHRPPLHKERSLHRQGHSLAAPAAALTLWFGNITKNGTGGRGHLLTSIVRQVPWTSQAFNIQNISIYIYIYPFRACGADPVNSNRWVTSRGIPAKTQTLSRNTAPPVELWNFVSYLWIVYCIPFSSIQCSPLHFEDVLQTNDPFI